MAILRFAALSCLHAPITSPDYFNWAMAQIADFKPDVLVNLGDWYEGLAASRHSRHPLQKWTLFDEHREVLRQAQAIRAVAPEAKKVWMYGNHDCFDDQTDVLTDSGWKRFQDLTGSEQIASVEPNTGVVRYALPLALIRKQYDGEMLQCENQAFSFKVTPTHRMVARTFESERYQIRSAESLLPKWGKGGGSQWVMPTAAFIPTEDSVSEDEARLAAWILTDGVHSQNICIYQRESNHQVIKDLLDRMGIEYSLKRRTREARPICGRTLVKAPETSCTFNILAGSRPRVREIISTKVAFPKWAFNCPKNVFDAFLDAFIDGDGTYNKGGTGATVYGRESALAELQIACILHGYRAILKEYRKGDWKLKVVRTSEASILKSGRAITKTHYKGEVFCATTVDGTLIVRRNGKPMVCGNCNLFGIHADRLPDDIREVANWRNYRGLPEELSDWHILESYSHRACWNLGQITFAHGCAITETAPQDAAYLYGVPNGLYISGHTHRPQRVTQCRIRKVPMPYWIANPGTGIDFDKCYYMARNSMAFWGRGLVIGEVHTKGEGREWKAKPNWSAETRVHSWAHPGVTL